MSAHLATRRFVIVFIMGIALSARMSVAAVWYVDVNATGAVHDGSSWCQAYLDLQDALDAAGAGDDIHVADGTYRPDRGTGDREASFRLVDGVAIRGSYAGCGAPDPDARNPVVSETILSGDLLGNDSPLTTQGSCESFGGTWYRVLCDRVPGNEENSFHVVASVGNDATAVLDGVTVSDGNADGVGLGPTPDSDEQGAGINVYFGTPTITNCLILNNRMANHGALNDHGGATITNCTFRGNFSELWGGGLHSHIDRTSQVSGCLFEANATAGKAAGGGAAFLMGGAALSNCQFINNHSGVHGGAVYVDSGGEAILDGCLFQQNVAATNGGGLYNNTASPTLTNCTFDANVAEAFPGGGGAMYSLNGTPFLRDCVIKNNMAPNYNGAGVYIDGGRPTFVNCRFESNRNATHGGGVLDTAAEPTFVNCTFVDNVVRGSGGAIATNFGSQSVYMNCLFIGNSANHGGALRIGGVNPTTPLIANCTFSGNDSAWGGAAVHNYGSGQAVVLNSVLWTNGDNDESSQVYGGTPTVNFSCVQGLTGALGGVGNIGTNPRFVDALGPDGVVGTGDEDLHLADGSPCIDAGDNALVPPDTTDVDNDGDLAEPTPRDLDLGGRFLDNLTTPDTGHGTPPLVDLGAYERGDDCNGNGVPDDQDILGGTSEDCNHNGVPDECDGDCNANGLADECELDTDGDGVIDDCDGCPDDFFKTDPGPCGCGVSDVDTDADSVPDCLDACPGFDDREDADHDGVPDGCDLCDGYNDQKDCNGNGTPDGCDINNGTSEDINGNGIPDECDSAPVIGVAGCRYLAVAPLPGENPVALRITDRNRPCLVSYVDADGGLTDLPVYQTPDQWGTVFAHGVAIVPSTEYAAQSQEAGGPVSSKVFATTARWGDVTGGLVDGVWSPPNGSVEILDAIATLERFQNTPTAPPIAQCDLYPEAPDGRIDIVDVLYIINGFVGQPYPFDGPAPCS